MWRIEVSEEGQTALPAIDVADDLFVIGSAADARVRLPAEVAQPHHVRIDRGTWRALGPLAEPSEPSAPGAPGEGVRRSGGVDARGASGEREGRGAEGDARGEGGEREGRGAEGDARAEGGEREGPIGNGVTLAIGRYRVRIAPAPAGATATPPQRTESLARELARSLLGTAGAPTLEVVRGPVVGERRMLAPPESALVIGRGDEAGWVLLDEDLSRAHAEIRRGWDGTCVVDLESKNGTRLDGADVLAGGAIVRDGAQIELGKVVLRFRDPAEQHLRGHRAAPVSIPPPAPAKAATEPRAPREPRPPPRASVLPFYAALGVMIAAVAGLVWILAFQAT